MTTEQQLNATREAIVKANNPGLSLEEALEKELGFGCKVLVDEDIDTVIYSAWRILQEYGEIKTINCACKLMYDKERADFKILGLPITLFRITKTLLSMEDKIYTVDALQDIIIELIHFKWDFTKPDDLFQQDDETGYWLFNLIVEYGRK